MRPALLLIGLSACLPEPGRSPYDPADDWDGDGWIEDDGDCDDQDAAISPVAVEACDAAVDVNCDGATGPCAVTGEMSVLDGLGAFSGTGVDDGWPLAALGAVGLDDSPWVGTGSVGGYTATLWHFQVTDGGLDGLDKISLGTSSGDPEISRIAGAGDVDGDYEGDVLVSVFDPWTTGAGNGGVFVAFGRFVGDRHLPIDPDTVQWIGPEGDSAGAALANGGDFDGDGDTEILIGAPGHGGGAGAVWWVAGDPALRGGAAYADLDSVATGVWEGDPASEAGLGTALCGIGDVDGDGVEDVAIGSFGRPEPFGMEVFVVLGADGGLNGTRPLSDIAHANYGTIRDGTWHGYPTSVAGLGDLDGDGRDDLAVGTPGDSAYSGSAWIVLGAPAGAEMALSDTAQVEINGAVHFGAAVAAGDLDADGIPDLIVGSPREDDGAVAGAGAAWLFAGATLRETGEFYADQHAYAVVRGTDADGLAGLSLAVAGDVDFDGDDDFVLGERYGADGTSWLFLGGP